MSRRSVSGSGAGASAPPAVADNYPRQPSIDIQHYVFRVTLTDENDQREEVIPETFKPVVEHNLL